MHSRYAIHFHLAMNVKMIITKYKTNNIVGCFEEGVHCRSMCTYYLSMHILHLHMFRCKKRFNQIASMLPVWMQCIFCFDEYLMKWIWSEPNGRGQRAMGNGNNADYNFQWWINEQSYSFNIYGIRQKYFNLQLIFRKWETETKWNNKIK